ncbi:MAG TPA: hypothetical protein VIX90_05485 [Edaphobacter sp.]
MKGHGCCEVRADGGPHPPSLPRRGARAVGWVLPSAVMVLMPKCPMCVVAYVAVVTGAGISVAAAAELRVGVLVLCVMVLGWGAAKAFLRRRVWLGKRCW